MNIIKNNYRLNVFYVIVILFLLPAFVVKAERRGFVLQIDEKGQFANSVLQDTVTDSVSGTDLEKILRYVAIKMSRMQLSGNPDYDFAVLMLEHSKGALELAEMEIENGKDSVLKKIAAGILDRKRAEIEDLKKLRDEYMEEGRKERDNAVTGSAGNSTLNDQSFSENRLNNVALTDNLDYDFASLMLTHHQSAIDLSSRFLNDAEIDKTKRIARNIIKLNKKEIRQLKKWQDKIMSSGE